MKLIIGNSRVRKRKSAPNSSTLASPLFLCRRTSKAQLEEEEFAVHLNRWYCRFQAPNWTEFCRWLEKPAAEAFLEAVRSYFFGDNCDELGPILVIILSRLLLNGKGRKGDLCFAFAASENRSMSNKWSLLV